MSVSIQEMQFAATELGPPINISNEVGNVIEINNLSDDLGLNMLANQSKIRPESTAPSFGSSPIRLSVPESDYKEVKFADTLEPIELNSFGAGSTTEIPAASNQPLAEVSINKGTFESSSGFGNSAFGNYQSSSTSPSISLTPAAPRDFEAEKQEKIEYLNKLQRLELKGYPVSKRFTMDNTLDEVKQEYNRLVDARNLEGSLRFQRQMMMGAITGLEWMNDKFDPFDIKLQGWSESVHTNIEDFDEIFEELYDKYKERGKMPPEMRLMMAVAGSGFMCHVSNSFFRQKMPTMDDVLRNNPMLAKQMAQAAASQAGPGFGNFMGMAMGMPQGGGMPQVPASAAAMDPSGPTGAFFGNNSRSAPNPSQEAQAAASTPRREMRGPSGVDDILKTFEEVRRVELETIGRSPPPVNNQQQPAMVAVSELQSVASDDFASQAESSRTGGARRRGRRTAPVGNMVSIDV
jgi:hypothetical protein